MHNYRILILEDSKHDLELLQRALKEKSTEVQFEVVHVNLLPAALGLLENNGFDAVIADLRTDRVWGFTAIEEIRRIDPSIPLIVVSGLVDYKLAIEALELGADEVRQKPPDNIVWIVGLAIEKKKLKDKAELAFAKKLKLENNLANIKREEERTEEAEREREIYYSNKFVSFVVDHKKLIVAIVALLTALVILLNAIIGEKK